jgi:hypothetical protein
MGSTFEDFGDPDRSSRAGLLQRLAHLLPWVTASIVVHDLVWTFDLFLRWGWFGRGIDIFFSVLWVVTVIVSAMHVDVARLCLKCMEAVKADAPLRVQRPRTRALLKLHHVMNELPFWQRLAGFVLMISVPIFCTQVLKLDVIVARLIYLPFDLLLIAWIYATWPHHKYRPWCPWCRRWDEGGEHEPSPDPVDSGEKVA